MRMKKFFFILFGVLLLLSCKKEQGLGKLNVVAANFPLYDFAREVGGTLVNVKALSTSYYSEPSLQDIIAIQNADIFLSICKESDEWTILDFSENEEHNPNECDNHKDKYDEHIWTNPMNAISMVKKIAEIFGKKDTANKRLYVTRAAEYVVNLIALDSAFSAVTQNKKRKTMVFGDCFPFKHFAEEYDLEYYSAFPDCFRKTEPSIATVAFLIDKLKTENIPVIFHIEFSDESVANAISQATGSKKMLFHSIRNVNDTNESYLNLMRKNVDALEAAL